MIEKPIRVMLVDDEKDFVEILSLILKEAGIETTSAYGGCECLAKLSRKEIDVVVLDIRMPDIDGIETLREIKKKFPLVEVIMLTGHGTDELAVEAMQLGAFDFLLKPTDHVDLLSKLKAAANKKDQQKAEIRKAEETEIL